MEFTILDLEWNCGYHPLEKKYFNEIIQFGAVRLNEKFEILDRLDVFVCPRVVRKLTSLVENLTNITADDLKNGVRFEEAMERFRVFSEGSVLMTWATGDIRVLAENYTFFTGQKYPLGGLYADLQAYCQMRLQQPDSQQIGLSTAAGLLGIETEEMQLHRAIDDSILSAQCFAKLYDPEAFQPFIKPCDKKFFDRLMFKNVVLVDLNHPLIDKKRMVFLCPDCGQRMEREKDWELLNKQFFSEFICPKCKKKYRGRYQFKLKYDGVQVKKGLSPYRPPKPTEEKSADKTKEEKVTP